MTVGVAQHEVSLNPEAELEMASLPKSDNNNTSTLSPRFFAARAGWASRASCTR